MADTVTESVAANDQAEPSAEAATVEQKLIDQLVEQARNKGLQLTGEGGLLQQLTKTVLESALEGEITDHLGYDKHDPAGKDGGNSRNGTRSKTVLTDIGPVEIDMPRDREGSFEPATVKKRQRRLTGVEEMVLSLSAKARRPPGRGRTRRRSPRTSGRRRPSWSGPAWPITAPVGPAGKATASRRL